MGFYAAFAAPEGLPKFFETAGEDATFTPDAGDPIPCKVFIDFNVMLQPAGVNTQVWARGTTIEGLLSVLGREPKQDETFTVNSIVYTVQGILENDGLTVKVAVTS
jgi:hypothetical protein